MAKKKKKPLVIKTFAEQWTDFRKGHKALRHLTDSEIQLARRFFYSGALYALRTADFIRDAATIRELNDPKDNTPLAYDHDDLLDEIHEVFKPA